MVSYLELLSSKLKKWRTSARTHTHSMRELVSFRSLTITRLQKKKRHWGNSILQVAVTANSQPKCNENTDKSYSVPNVNLAQKTCCKGEEEICKEDIKRLTMLLSDMLISTPLRWPTGFSGELYSLRGQARDTSHLIRNSVLVFDHPHSGTSCSLLSSGVHDFVLNR